MTDRPPKEDDNLPEQEATERFNRLVGNLVNTPHQPHKPHKDERHKQTKRKS